MPKTPIKKPNYKYQWKMSVRDELRALGAFLRFHWQWVLIVSIGLGVFLHEIRPFPPRTVTIATGQPNSTYEDIADFYEAYFAERGVTLVRKRSDGALENVETLSAGGVDVAFSQGGIPVPKDASIVSLGSIQYEPLWLFYRGPEFHGADPLEFLQKKRLSVGAEKSGTRAFVMELIRQHQLKDEDAQNLVVMNAEDSVEAVLDGRLDGMFLLANTESKDLIPLIERSDIHLWNFSTARAIGSKIPYITAVTLPIGAISLTPIRPAREKELVATTTTILANRDLHPAIQYLFMMASADFYRQTHVYFPRPGGFPAFTDTGIPRSVIAEKYLSIGPSGFEHMLPFWMASFIDRIWLMLAALVAVAYPLFRMVPQYRKFHFKYDLDDRYIDLMRIENAAHDAKTTPEMEQVWKAFNELEQRISETWVPSGSKEKFFTFCNAMELLRLRLERIQEKLAKSTL
jgi:TRAP-type uncharacterized transport system substrate-binding protein